jgi:hypothetical protein
MWWEANGLCPVSGQRPSFLDCRQSEYWTYVDDLDQVETALHTIAALQSDAPSSKPSVRAADTSPEFIPHICSARMNQLLASGTQPWRWVS